MTIFLAPEAWPFLVAGVIILVIAGVELLALLVGASVSGGIEALLHHADAPELPPDSWLGWLHVGRVPVLVLLVLFLAAFAVVGLVADVAALAFAGWLLPPLIAVPAAALVALPATRTLA